MRFGGCRGTVFTPQKLFYFFFFLHFLGTFGVELLHLFQFLLAELWQVADKMDQLPTILIFLRRVVSPRRHAGQAYAIVNDVEQLPIGERLCVSLAHVGRLGIQMLPDLGLPAAVIAVAGGAMIGKVRPRLC